MKTPFQGEIRVMLKGKVDKSRLPSRHVTEGPSRAPHRSYVCAMGLTEEEAHQPFVGVATCWIEAARCNITLNWQAQPVKIGDKQAQGTPRACAGKAVTGTGGPINAGLPLPPITDEAGIDYDLFEVIIIRKEGPVGGSDMPKMLATISATRGFCVGHVGPEAAAGGPVGLLKDGDMITINAIICELSVAPRDDERAARKAEWKGPRPITYAIGALWKCAQSVGNAVYGAVTHPGGTKEAHVYMDI